MTNGYPSGLPPAGCRLARTPYWPVGVSVLTRARRRAWVGGQQGEAMQVPTAISRSSFVVLVFIFFHYQNRRFRRYTIGASNVASQTKTGVIPTV
jgi:hypothetical protein